MKRMSTGADIRPFWRRYASLMRRFKRLRFTARLNSRLALSRKIIFFRRQGGRCPVGAGHDGCRGLGPKDVFTTEAAGRKSLSAFKESRDSRQAAQALTFRKGFRHYRLSRYNSMARATEGASGVGALTSILRPASSIAFTMDLPKETILMSPCWKSGKFSWRDFTSATL